MFGLYFHYLCRETFAIDNVGITAQSQTHVQKDLNHLWPRKGKDLCVQWNHVKLIIFYYHFVPAIHSAVHCREEDALSVSFFAHPLMQLCASLCTLSQCEHISPFVFQRSVHVSRFWSLRLNASVPGQWRIISEGPRCVGLWEVDSPHPLSPHSPPGGLEGFKGF